MVDTRDLSGRRYQDAPRINGEYDLSCEAGTCSHVHPTNAATLALCAARLCTHVHPVYGVSMVVRAAVNRLAQEYGGTDDPNAG